MSDREAPDPGRVGAHLILTSYRRTQFIAAAAALGIFDRLSSGPQPAPELAAASGSHAKSLYRLLRALVAMQVLEEDPDGRFRLTPLGRHYTSDGLGPAARYFASDPGWSAWSRLADAVRTGERAFELVHGMRDWDYYVQHPESGAVFDAAMRSLTSPSAGPVIAAHDFSRYRTVVDVGGGDGTLLAAILLAHPGLEGVLFDRPDVVTRARERLAAAGLADRCQMVSGSFLDSVPEGGDAYVMKWILHDWEDGDAERILATCRRSMAAGTDLVVVERIVPEHIGPQDIEIVMSDLQMLVMNGGVERTERQFAALLAATGFRFVSLTATGTPVSVLRAVAE